MVQDTQKLSAQDRLTLIQTLNALPQPQFDELVFALNPPNQNVPSNSAPQGDRSIALLTWAESRIGPGLSKLEILLELIITTHSNKATQLMAIVIRGDINTSTASEIHNFVQHLKQKNQYDSIEIEFFTKGSIKIILSGSPEELEKLQELIESGEIEILKPPPVKAIYKVDNATTDARKAQLIAALRLHSPIINANSYALDSALHRAMRRARDLASTIFDTLHRNQASIGTLQCARGHTLDLYRNLYRDRDLYRNLYRDRDLYRARDIAIDRILDCSRSLYLALDRTVDLNIHLNLNHTISKAHTLYLDLTQSLYLYPYRDLRNINLSGANLRNIDLRNADITGADFTNADVTGTIFGNNKGLTGTDKRDLEKRGAIFQEPPSSDVPSLVLR